MKPVRNILITGGGGFIGSNLADAHVDSGDNVTIVDNYSTSLKTKYTDRESIVLNLNHPESIDIIDDILPEMDIVYHMAGSVGVKHVDRDPRGTLQNSFNINNNMFPLFEKHNTSVIFASTSEVYGNTDEAKETDDLRIGSPDTLRWGYACAKLMSEFLLKTYAIPHTIVRFFNVTGKRQLSDYGMVLPTFIEHAKKNNDIIVHGDGLQYRCFCDIRDAINMLLILSNKDHVGEIYNIGNTNNVLTINQLAKIVIELTNSTSIIKNKPYTESFSKQFGEIYKRKPNTDKINQYYTPKHDIYDIINSML